jgi:hypothetical protein
MALLAARHLDFRHVAKTNRLSHDSWAQKAVADVLALLGTKPAEWVNIYEIVNRDSEGIEGRGWATGATIKNFKRTAKQAEKCQKCLENKPFCFFTNAFRDRPDRPLRHLSGKRIAIIGAASASEKAAGGDRQNSLAHFGLRQQNARI